MQLTQLALFHCNRLKDLSAFVDKSFSFFTGRASNNETGYNYAIMEALVLVNKGSNENERQ